MVPDEHGESTICNIYYDTADYRLIRASLEKPAYKEKLRLRSYGVTEPGGEVFLELKKKYKGIVYKRRITLPEEGEKHRAAPLTFGEVGPQHIDTRVRFDGVQFADAGKTWCDTDPETGRTVATERTILDAGGNEFTVRSAATCVYAKEPVPSGTGSLYGIIDYFAGKYTLRVTNREIVFSRTATPYAAHPEWQTPDPGVREPHATAATPPKAYPSDGRY